MKSRTKAYLYLLIAAAIWGVAGAIIKFTLGGISPLYFLTYRFSISAAIAIVFLIVDKDGRPKSNMLLKSLTYGLLAYYIALGLLFWGLNYATVLDLSIVSVVEPLLVLVGGGIFFHDKITRKEKNGALIAFIGTAVALILPLLFTNRVSSTMLTGAVLLLGFLLADAGGILYSKHLLKEKVSAFALTNIGMLTAGILFMATTIAAGNFSEFLNTVYQLPITYHLGVWYMALISGTLGYYFFTRGTRTIEVSEAGLFYYLQPVFQIPLAILWLNETITPIFILGSILIIAGVFIAEKK